MEKKLDLRIQKTYLALTAALLSMMEEQRFEDIRIGGLCDRAMVRKSTFYKHFGDKYELLAFVVRQKQESLNARLAAQRVEGDTVEYYTRLIGLVFDFLADNEALVRTAIQSNSFPLILSILSEQIIRDIQQQLKGDARRGEKLPAPPEVMAPFFVGGASWRRPTAARKGASPSTAASCKTSWGCCSPASTSRRAPPRSRRNERKHKRRPAGSGGTPFVQKPGARRAKKNLHNMVAVSFI